MTMYYAVPEEIRKFGQRGIILRVTGYRTASYAAMLEVDTVGYQGRAYPVQSIELVESRSLQMASSETDPLFDWAVVIDCWQDANDINPIKAHPIGVDDLIQRVTDDLRDSAGRKGRQC